MEQIKDLGEDGIIGLFNSIRSDRPVVLGIGDDCAILEWKNDEYLLLTTDMLIEDIHFTLDTISPTQLGIKALAVNLSDIASMGGTPIAALLAISLPGELSLKWFEEFKSAITSCADEFKTQIIGGDTCGSKSKISITITVLGSVAKSNVLLRSGAKADDDIWISGIPGESATGLALIMAGVGANDSHDSSLIDKHVCPQPMVSLGKLLSQKQLATSCIDTSDGLVKDLIRICTASSLSAVLFESLIPLPAKITFSELSPLHFALNGGEDYQLLFTAHSDARKEIQQFENVTRIGKMLPGDTLVYLQDAERKRRILTPEPFDHFGNV